MKTKHSVIKGVFPSNKGMTLIEVTVVIALILSLIAILLVGFNAYKLGADRAKCLLNISNIQKAGRSWCNLNEVSAGETAPNPVLSESDLIAKSGGASAKNVFIPYEPKCPSHSTSYTIKVSPIPDVGEAFATCADPDFGGKPASAGGHLPKSTDGW